MRLIRDFLSYRRARRGATMVIFVYPHSLLNGDISEGRIWLSPGDRAFGLTIHAGEIDETPYIQVAPAKSE